MNTFLEKIEIAKTKTNLATFINTINNDVEFQNYLQHVTYYLDDLYTNITHNQRLFHIFFKTGVQKCKCGKILPWNKNNRFSKNILLNNYNKTCGDTACLKDASSFKTSCIKNYGVENISQTAEWKDKVKSSNLEKFGTEWQFQSENCKQKSKKTWLEKYGTEHHASSQQTKDKKAKTNLLKYGGASPMCDETVRQLSKNICLEKYGVSSPMKTDEIKDAVKLTNNNRYNVNWFVETDRCQSIKYRQKEYTLPSGKAIKLLGYENKFLDEFFLRGGREEDIYNTSSEISAKIGQIFYYTEDGKKHRYFPDFYIKSENKVIEVKSEYTYNVDKEVNELKKQAVLEKGINFEFKIY